MKPLLVPAIGVGPLLQRDYWAVICRARPKPSQIIELIAQQFWTFAPEELVIFRRRDGTCAPLTAGDEMDVHIRFAGKFLVRVLHIDANSVTLGTAIGHPESGRITFGAYRNEQGDVIFHIRSRARSSSKKFYSGFLAIGDAMQTNTWAEFVNRVALTVGDGVLRGIHAEKSKVEVIPEDSEFLAIPTFLARGD